MKNYFKYFVIIISFVRIELNALNITWGLSARQGDRNEMEDTHTHIIPFNNKYDAFFAIYDGHSGFNAAQIAAQKLHTFLPKSKILNSSDFKQAFLDTDAIITKTTASGACALTACINKNNLYIAWTGDSRAVLTKNSRVIFATTDHKPDNAIEKKRIEDAGGFVTNFFRDVARVNGQLAVARALGDRFLKPNLVIATPDIYQMKVNCSQIKSIHMLILACDGVWDVLSNQEAANIAHNAFNKHIAQLELEYPEKPLMHNKKTVEKYTEEAGDSKLKLVARALRDTAYQNGSTDNISVQVIIF